MGQYLSNFEMHGKSQMDRSRGPFKSLYLRVFTGTNMFRDDSDYDLESSNWHVVYRPQCPELEAIEASVIDLCKRDITHEVFGFTYKDLMELDYPTYVKLRRIIVDMSREKEERVNELKKNMEMTKK
jgi:hypothetical protein